MLGVIQNIFKNKKNILIATGTKHNSDILFAGLALHIFLKNKGISNNLISNKLSKSKIWEYKLKDFPKINYSNNIPKKLFFTLPLNYNIDDITWEKDNKEYKVAIKINNQVLNTNDSINIKEEKSNYDLLIYIGNKSQINNENLGIDKDEFNKIEKLIILSNRIIINNTSISDKSFFKSKSFSYKVNKLLLSIDNYVNSDINTLLLAGIINHTDGYKKNISPEIFDTSKKLIELGGDYQKAFSLSSRDLTKNKIVFLSKLLSSINEISDGVYIVNLKFKGNKIPRVDVSEMMKISEIYNCELAIIILESDIINKIYFKSLNIIKYDLKKLLIKHKGKGNSKQGIIETKEDINNTINTIIKELNIQIKVSQKKN